jgi:hypothetical protein
MKPTLKPHGTERLKLMCDVLLSTSTFKFNLRRFVMAVFSFMSIAITSCTVAGAYTRSLFSST